MTNHTLFEGCPPQFRTYMEYCNNLQFEEAADFTMLKFLVITAAEDAKLDIFDDVFDWSLILAR